MGIFRQIVTGASWNVFGQAGRQIIALGTMVVLVRLLRPEDFGLVAMCHVVIAFAYIFARMGMGSAIIQRKDIDDTYLSTAYWATFFMGFVMAGAIAAGANVIALFFERAEIKWIVLTLGINFIFGGVSGVHHNLLERRMLFKKISFIDILSSLFGSATAIYMAIKGMGYWSLVAKEIFSSAFRVPLLWGLSGWRPKLLFSWKCFKDLFGFSFFVLLSSLLNFFNRHGDNLIIGRFLGATPLGLYNFAYRLMLKPLHYVSFTITRAVFPALSKIQEDKPKVQDIYLQIVKLISMITFPAMTGLFLISPDLIRLVFGTKWEGAIPVFQILCFVGMWQSIGTTVGTIFLSQGKSALAFKMSLIISPIVWIAFGIGTIWGVTGVALCYAVVSGCWWLISHYIANSIIELDMRRFLRTLFPALRVSVFTGIGLYLIQKVLTATYVPLILRLCGTICFGIVIYLIIIFRSKDEHIITARERIIKRIMPVEA